MKLEYHGKELKKPLQVDKLKYIVVGTGRCGTVYMAKLLTSIGLPCGHETIFLHDGFEHALARLENQEKLEISLIAKLASVSDEEQGIPWFNSESPLPLVADASYMAAPFLDRPELKDVKIIHVIREPMKVINSFVEGLQYFRDKIEDEEHIPYHKFIYQHVPELEMPMDPVSRAALYYIRWNEMIETKCQKNNYYRHRIESNTEKLLSFLDIQKPSHFYKNRQSNHKITLQDKWTNIEQIQIPKIRDMLHRIKNRYYYKINLMV